MGRQPRLRLDAAIVGGGLTGYLLGASLADAGVQVAVIELHGRAEEPAVEAASLLCSPMLGRIQTAYGPDAARMHVLRLQEQLRALTAAPLPYVQVSPAFTFALTSNEMALLARQHALLSGLHLPVRITQDTGGCPFPIEQSLFLPGQGVVNVTLWIEALRGSIRRLGGMIYSGIRHISLDGTQIHTEHGRINAPQIILTTDKPLDLRSRRLLSLLETHLFVHSELAAPWTLHSLQQSPDGAFQLLPTPRGAVATWDAGRLGTRPLQRRCRQFQHLLSTRMPDWQQESLRYSPQVISADGLPFIGILPGARYLFANGYGDCPILGAMHAADVLSRRMLGQLSPEDRLYEPDRAVPSALVNRTALRNARRYAAGMLRPNAPVCPHCGCRMRYFPPLQQWGCPFCGSAYTIFGRPACGPAVQSTRVSTRQRPV